MSRFLTSDFRTPLVDDNGSLTPEWQKKLAGAVVLEGTVGGEAKTGNTDKVQSGETRNYLQSVVNGLGNDEFHTVQTTGYSTSAVRGAIAVPGSATKLQANGVEGAVTNASPNTNAVGGYFPARATANGVKVWGGNVLVQLDTFTGCSGIGIEVDCNVNTTSVATLNGVQVSGNFDKQPAAGSNAIIVNKPNGTGKWNFAFVTNDGSCQVAALIGVLTTGNNQPSQNIQFNGRDSGGVARAAIISGSANGDLVLTPGASVIAPRLRLTGLQAFANNAAAVSGGLLVGDLYRTGGNPDLVCIVH